MAELLFKYATEQTRMRPKGQEFCSKKVQYRLNEATNLLVEDGVVDIDELIASALETPLDKLLESYLPSEVSKVNMDGRVYEVKELQSNLDFMQSAFIRAQELKAKYGLGEDLSVNEVFSEVVKIKGRVDDFVSYETKRKEGEKNERKDIESIVDDNRGIDGINSADNVKVKEVKGDIK